MGRPISRIKKSASEASRINGDHVLSSFSNLCALAYGWRSYRRGHRMKPSQWNILCLHKATHKVEPAHTRTQNPIVTEPKLVLKLSKKCWGSLKRPKRLWYYLLVLFKPFSVVEQELGFNPNPQQFRAVHGSIFITHDPTQPTDIQTQPNPTQPNPTQPTK